MTSAGEMTLRVRVVPTLEPVQWVEARRRTIYDALEQGLVAAFLIALPYLQAANAEHGVGSFPFREVGGLAVVAFVVSVGLAFLTWAQKKRYIGFAGNTVLQVLIAGVSTTLAQLVLSNEHVNAFNISYAHLFTVVGFAMFGALVKCAAGRVLFNGASLVPRVSLGAPRKSIGFVTPGYVRSAA